MEKISSGFAKDELAHIVRELVIKFHAALNMSDFKKAEITLLTLAALLGSEAYDKYSTVLAYAEGTAFEICDKIACSSFDSSDFTKEVLRKGFLIIFSALMEEPLIKSAFTFKEEIEIAADEGNSRFKQKSLTEENILYKLKRLRDEFLQIQEFEELSKGNKR